MGGVEWSHPTRTRTNIGCCEHGDEPADSNYARSCCVNINIRRGLMYRTGELAGSTEFCAICMCVYSGLAIDGVF
jgi:hypothetical protein